MLKLNIMKENIDQHWSIARIAEQAPPTTWKYVFIDAKADIVDISKRLEQQELINGQFFPLKHDIFAAFNQTPLTRVKVVIVGQDPYHQWINIDGVATPRAMGLSFSVRKGDKIPSSLTNIFTELSTTVNGFQKPDHGDLRQWAHQGVLLLNTSLTVRPNQPGSHESLWLGLITKVFKAISSANPNCIYLLWGQQAQKLKPMLGDRSVIFETSHPSGLSAKRGFFGSNHFNRVNVELVKQGKSPICWSLDPMTPQIRQLPMNDLYTSEQVDNRKQLPLLQQMSLPDISTNMSVPNNFAPNNFGSNMPVMPNTFVPAIPIINYSTNIKPTSSYIHQLPMISKPQTYTVVHNHAIPDLAVKKHMPSS